ncbi:MAG: dihydrodipicolinate reductase C-terminal domain-containing protein [Candidatus Falkowbacteria bacterium]
MKRKTRVLVNGLPGKMAWQIALEIINSDDLELIPFGLTGPEITIKSIVCDGMTIKLFHFSERAKLIEVLHGKQPDIVVDFTAPVAVKDNFDFYLENHWPFVLGTTFGEFDGLDDYIKRLMKGNSLNAVIASNMAKEVVAMMAMIEYAATNFPDAFKGCSLKIVESHQGTKKDPSGTAISLIKFFNKLGLPFVKEEIKKMRTEEEHDIFGVPVDHRGRHGWHTYSIEKQDGSVFLEFKHNVNGGQAYISGVMDAIRFLAKVEEVGGAFGEAFSMVDVLRGTSLF